MLFFSLKEHGYEILDKLAKEVKNLELRNQEQDGLWLSDTCPECPGVRL